MQGHVGTYLYAPKKNINNSYYTKKDMYLQNHLCNILLYFFIPSCLMAESEVNILTKEKIIEAGCNFVSNDQLLERHVCLMPDYASNELPKDRNGVTNISLYTLQAFVLEVDEMKNKLTIELLQYLEWDEPRIKVNFSSASKLNKIKLLSKNIMRIWHPDLDIYTKDLKEWKSLYDPVLYQEIYFSSKMDTIDNTSFINLSALKSWKATIFCKMDFSLFPFDLQTCAFLQFGSTQDLKIISNCGRIPAENDKYKPDGFEVNLIPIGAYCENQEEENSSDQKPAQLLWTNTGFNITLKRIIQPYLYQYYFPSIAIVIVSFISFIIPLSAIPGRIVLVVTQFLTLTNIFIHQMV